MALPCLHVPFAQPATRLALLGEGVGEGVEQSLLIEEQLQ